MNNLCDLYLPTRSISTEFRFVKIFDKSFIYEENKFYEGFLNITVERISLLNLIFELRKKGITAYSVPIDYREAKIGKQEAFEIACTFAKKNDFIVSENAFNVSNEIPLFWSFSFTDKAYDIVGGILRFDRLDGHEWSNLDYLMYMHDYNHILFE